MRNLRRNPLPSRPIEAGANSALHHADFRQLHAFVVGATAAFGDDPVDDLVGVGDVAGLAVDAIRGVDLELCAVLFAGDLVNRRGTEILAGIAVLYYALRGACRSGRRRLVDQT